MVQQAFLHIARHTEGRDMRAHQSPKIDQHIDQRENDCHPAVVSDIRCRRKVRGDFDYLPNDSPKIDERH